MISAEEVKVIDIRGKRSLPKRHHKAANQVDGWCKGNRHILKEGDCRKYGEYCVD